MATFDILEKGLWVDYDPNGRYWNSRWNMLDEVRSKLTLPKSISITDEAACQERKSWRAVSLLRLSGLHGLDG